MMPSLITLARRVADRIERERAAADQWHCEKILTSECDSAGIIGDEARAQVAAIAAQFPGANARPGWSLAA